MKDIIQIKKTKDTISYMDAMNFMENKVKRIYELDEKEMIWFLNHSSISHPC